MAYIREDANYDPEKSSPDQKELESKTKPKLTSAQWWRYEELNKKPHEILDNLMKQIEDDQQGRYEAYREYERLFGASVGPNGDSSFREIISDQYTQNELQNTLETLWAQVFKNKIAPAISVSEADWDEWDKARSFSRWLEGAFDESKVYEDVFPPAGMGMLVHGTGCIRVGWEEIEGDDQARVISWPVNMRYVYVDRMEAKHGKPRSLYFKDHIDRFKLFEIYKDNDDSFFGSVEDRLKGINDAQSNDDLDLGTVSTDRCDMVTVREVYHLPSGPGANDGWHCLWIKGCTLVMEPYEWDVYPAVFMRFGCRMEGFYGESAAKRLGPSQKLLDRLTTKLDECQQVMGVPRILVGNGAGVVKTQHIDDIPGAIISVDNVNQVKDWNAETAAPELYRERDSIPSKMRALMGISDFESTQNIPHSMRDVSGAMLERWVDQGPSRHAMTHDQYESAVKDLAYLYMCQAEWLQKHGYDIVVKATDGIGKTSVQELSFKDVSVQRKKLKLRVQSMSEMPQSFFGKVNAFEKMSQAGYPVDQKTVMRMLEVPDLAGEQDMLVSDEEIIMKNLSHMVRTGNYLSPMPFDNLDLIVQLTTRYINRYRVRENSDSDRVALLAQYIDDAVNMKNGLGGPDGNAPPSVSQTLGFGPGMSGQVPPNMGPPGMPPQPQGQLPPGPPMSQAPVQPGLMQQ